MLQKSPVFLLLSLFFFTACKSISTNTQNTQPSTLLIDLNKLAETKSLLNSNNKELHFAYSQLIQEAEVALKEGPFSVTDKTKLPPSGNKHDYSSYSRYWFPDPDKPDGLPYIRRDGETNPESQRLDYSDRARIGKLGVNTETLGLAYYLTGDKKYAEKAAELLRVWFLNEETKMNSNVNHSQIRPGHNEGTKSGVLDGRMLIHAFEGSLLIANSSALTVSEQEGLKNWATEYYKWLSTSKLGLEEKASKNNHGSYYDVQALYFSLYAENETAATKIAENFIQNRLYAQIQADGSMPEELARTRPLFYSIFNLHAMFLIAHMAEKVQVDIWKAKENDPRLRKGLDYLLPYIDEKKSFPYPSIEEVDRMEFLMLLQMADDVYKDQNYLQKAEILPLEKRKTERSNLAIPLIR